MTYHLGSISNVEETCKQKRFKQKLIALGKKKHLKKNIRQNGLGKMYTNFTNPAPTQKLWKIIGSLSVPAKVRNFVWRAAKNAISVKTNLVKRQVLQEEICNHCKTH